MDYQRKLTEETNLLSNNISELESILIDVVKSNGFSEDDEKKLARIGTDILFNAKFLRNKDLIK